MPGPAVSGVRLSLWRAQAVFRAGACLFCVAILLNGLHRDARPAVAGPVAAAILAWTVVAVVMAVRGRANRLSFVCTDIGVVALLTLLTLLVQTPTQLHGHAATLTTVWAAAPSLGAAIFGGWPLGAAAAIGQGAVSVIVRQGYDANTVNNIVLLVLAAASTGYVTQLATRAEQDLADVTAQQAASAERDRLARSIHDGVLQVLALVQRRGAEIGGTAAQLGHLAGEQESALRALITSAPQPDKSRGRAHRADLTTMLTTLRSARVTVSTPAQPIRLDAHRAGELVAAVHAALDNVRRHAGPDAHAWVLLEQDDDHITVTVRDDGIGIVDGRLADASAQGRLGVSTSICGRITALGGTADVTSTPGQGTEIEMRIPA